MIFVSVGSSDIPFNRLIEGVDNVACMVGETVLAQIGNSSYIPKNFEFFKFCKREKMMTYVQNANIIICHAGFGTIGDAIKYNKPAILVPRESKYGEALHEQYELAEYLADQNESIVCVRDINLLPEAVIKIRKVHVSYKYHTTIPALIDKFIAETFSMKA